MINKYKVTVGKFFLKRELKKLKRNKQNFSLDNAQTIGILYEYVNDDEFKVVEDLIHELQGLKKEVKVLSFIPGNNILEYIPQKLSVDYFQQKDLSWYLSPKSTYLSSFVEAQYDILIDLNLNNCFPLTYVAATSKAKYKVGIDKEGKMEILDLIIRPMKNGLKEGIEEILHFLKVLKAG